MKTRTGELYNPQRKPMKRQSTKKQAENRHRAKLKKELVSERGSLCQARVLEVCSYQASDMHEILTRGRGGSAVDPDNILLVCRPCHGWIHANTTEATERGLLKSWGAV